MRLSLVVLVCGFSAIHAEEPMRAGPDWWAYQRLTKPTPPVGPHANPIDAFLAAKLKAKGLAYNPPADRATLLRRLTYDLTGLPPTPAEIEAFQNDASKDAYLKVVRRLLDSEAYGERWARHWLDVVRFTESQGFEYDRLRDHAWHYRDYVIRAFNNDKPYAEFVREQIAGDVHRASGQEGVVATGMLVAGPFDQAGAGSVSTTIRGKVREDEMEEMLGTVGQTFLGVTINCARCHDHKFDPFSAKEYYQMKAVFDGVRGGDRELASAAESHEHQAALRLLEKQHEAVLGKVRELEAKGRERALAKRDPKAKEVNLVEPISRWTFDTDGRDSQGNLHATLKNGAKIAGGKLLVDGDKAFAETVPLDRVVTAKTLEAWVELPTLKQGGGGVISVQKLGGSQFDAIVYGERQPNIWMAGSDGFIRTRDQKAPAETSPPTTAVHMAITYTAEGRITLYRNGRVYGEGYTVRPATFNAKETQVVFGLRHTNGGKPYLNGAIDEARLYDVALTAEQVLASYQAGVARLARTEVLAALTDEERRILSTLEGTLEKLQRDLAARPKPGTVYAAKAFPLSPSVIYKRGDFEKPGDPVTAASPTVVQGVAPFVLPAETAEGERRAKFAEWVADKDNPLTWRVIVNRVWQYHFGEGLVRTPNDFGFNGDRPTQPELLDWLACIFRDSGGRLKALHELIVTSEAYQQASTFNAKAATIDADNRLYWRYAPHRLEAEAIRDALLHVSGKLNRQAGGPSYRPFKIETFNSAFYVLLDDDRPELNRRSVYRMNVNSAKDPLLDVLDCPDPAVKAPRRNTTTTPLQALAMMNNSFTERTAHAFAARLTKEATDLPSQITLAYRLAFNRPPTPEELARAQKVAATTNLKTVCWAIINASEFAYIR